MTFAAALSVAALPSSPLRTPASDLLIGDLLAEGGEGRVYRLPRQPHLVYKAYRNPRSGADLDRLVSWPASLGSEAALGVSLSSAWPCSVVVTDDGDPVGLLMPRAPRRFAIRHKDGQSRMASLSYLTADPAHRAAAYGLALPPPMAAERIALVLELARLLDLFGSSDPVVGHGDLSTKNVLWSLQRRPEIFVIDCDSAALFAPDGTPAGSSAGRRRAMTPNWQDPAVVKGGSPTLWTDRYSLGLVFLRVAGAANFPIQARQKGSEHTEIAVPVPSGPTHRALARPEAPVWDLCARSLTLVDPPSRPSAGAWVTVLAELLEDMGREDLATGPRPADSPGPAGSGAPDVTVVPTVVAAPRASGFEVGRPVPAQPVSSFTTTARMTASLTPAATPAPAKSPSEAAAQLRRFVTWWWALHRRAVTTLAAPYQRAAGVRRMMFCLLVDVVMLIVIGSVIALIASPVIEG